MAEKLYDAYQQEIELTSEQESCLNYSGNRTLMVKGYAGAGKSLVLMALAKKKLNEFGVNSQNKIAIFTFQHTLVSTTREMLHVNGEDETGAIVSTVNSYIKEIYDSLVFMGIAPKRSYPNGKAKDGDKAKRLKNVEMAIKKHQSQFGRHRFHDLPYEFWLDEFDWMKDKDVWKDDELYYLSIERRGRGSSVRMSESDRKIAFQIFVCYCDYLEKTEQGDWEDQTLFVSRNARLIPENKKYEYVFVDEAQDLSLAQMKVIKLLCKTDMTIAMDANQKIHNKSWTPKELGIESTTKKLTKSMRTTKQIDALAESVRSKNDDLLDKDDKNLRAIPEKDGPIPKLVHLKDQAAERQYVIDLVNTYRKSNPNLTIGIVAAKNTQIKVYSDWLATANIPHEQVTKDTTFSMAKPGVKVVSAYGAKGLEFNCVIIPMFAEGYFPYNYSTDDDEAMEQFLIKMRNLVYVSMTRAKNLLTLTWWGNGGSRFIADMDENLYQTEGEPFVIKVPERKKSFSKSENIESEVTEITHQNSVGELKTAVPVITTQESALYTYLKSRDLEVIDKREKGGALWLVGGKELDSIIKETKSSFGALWTFSEKGGNATKNRSGWFTKSKK